MANAATLLMLLPDALVCCPILAVPGLPLHVVQHSMPQKGRRPWGGNTHQRCSGVIINRCLICILLKHLGKLVHCFLVSPVIVRTSPADWHTARELVVPPFWEWQASLSMPYDDFNQGHINFQGPYGEKRRAVHWLCCV